MSASPTEVLVVIGFAEALSAPEVAWSLADAGFKVAAFSRRGRRPALRHSRHATVHEITAPESDCETAGRELGVLLGSLGASIAGSHVLLPLDDASLWLCGQMPAIGGWTLAGARGANAAMALDKGRQVKAAVEAGFDVPESFFASTVEEFSRCTLPLPLIIRPAEAVRVEGGRLRKGRNWICSDDAELAQALGSWNGAGRMLAQPFLQGGGEGIFGLALDTGIVAWSAHRRLRMMNPHGSGSSACASQPVPIEARLPVDKLIRQTRWRGLFMVETLRDRSGKLWFVEFNGRPWGSMTLSRRQGLEYPAWAATLALAPGAAIAVPAMDRRQVVSRNAGRELLHLLFVLKGAKSKAIRPWPSFWKTVFDLLQVRRGDSLYNWRRDDWRVFFGDCWCTLRDNLGKSRC
jgi:hypothetical protein